MSSSVRKKTIDQEEGIRQRRKTNLYDKKYTYNKRDQADAIITQNTEKI